ncbi:MAG: hypothetical protein II493_09285 [Spirochaetales bacterium]|nr:hypothetical protein [Spirochaetales bacterium]
MGAPFWDYSFPSVLKTYIENVFCIAGNDPDAIMDKAISALR